MDDDDEVDSTGIPDDLLVQATQQYEEIANEIATEVTKLIVVRMKMSQLDSPKL